MAFLLDVKLQYENVSIEYSTSIIYDVAIQICIVFYFPHKTCVYSNEKKLRGKTDTRRINF